jgi:chlorobactene glucosyltransferase
VPDLIVHLQHGSLVFLGVLLLITVSNCLAWRRLGAFSAQHVWPPVSVLVPARDEAANIRACVESLLAQDYPAFEVLVLDDASSDGTGEIVRGLAAGDARLRLLSGRPLPAGWLGKHWACHQLAEAAAGALWLFTDADTIHHPPSLRAAVAALHALDADLVTALPRQVMRSWGERLIVSLLPWSLFCFYPLALAQRVRWPALVMGIGQFMLFRREAYERIGGHAAVRTHVADDIALAQRLVTHGGRWRLLDGTAHVTCRMYSGFAPAFQGFSKNLYAAFGYAAPAFLAIWSWLGLVFLAPFILLALWAWGLPASPGPSLAAIGLAMTLWVLCVWRLSLPRSLVFIYPVSLALALIIAARSFILTRTGRAQWKERLLPTPR